MLAWLTIGNAAWSADTIDYTVSVKGVKSSTIEKAIIDVSQLLDETNRPVTTVRALRRRVDATLPRISALLRARGYYAAKQDYDINRKSNTSAAVIFEIDLGPRYRIGRYEIHPTGPNGSRQPIDIPFRTLQLNPGDPVRASKIKAADGLLLAALGRQGYPLARIEKRPIVVDHKTRTMSVDVFVATGPQARFGPTQTVGLSSVDRTLVARHVEWVQGQIFNTDLLEDLRSKLRLTGLFSSVLVQHADNTDANGELAVTINVTERKHRSIGAGASYSSTDGPLGKLFWEHRNLWGDGERLRLRGEGGEIRQGVFGDLRLSDYGSKGQDLVFDTSLSREVREGFTSIETTTTARLERRFSEIYSGSLGIGLDRSNVDENDDTDNFTYLTFPLSLRRDTSDDLLDPGKGGRNIFSVTPNIGIIDTDSSFYTALLSNTVYIPLLPEKKLILAGWGRLGTIFGESTLDIPANRRLYSGGAGSVRGYALNNIGPIDAEGDPIGGRSVTEFGAEFRWRAYKAIGIVAFAEAGGIYDNTVPKWGKDLFWGAGLGVRYLTKIGPLRLDFAVPLNRRNSVDDSFQILVSLGQAF